MPVSVCVAHHSPRLQWVLEFCSEMLGWDFIPVAQYLSGPVIRYGTSGQGLELPDAGLLWESGTERPWPEVQTTSDLPRLMFQEEGGFDVFSAIFWLVTEYAAWQQPVTDGHGRYVEPPLYSGLRLGELPLVHLWLEELASTLLAHWPELASERKPVEGRHRVSFDLDNPWKYLHKPFWVQAGGMVRDLVENRIPNLPERIRAWITGQDPYDTFGKIRDLCEVEETTLFALIQRRHPNDSRFTWQHTVWRAKIQELADQGFAIGIHPSYLASEMPGQIGEEAELLTRMLGQPVTSARMHFLRYRLPQTRQDMIRAGIREDLTLYRNGEGGFPNGMMRPYNWYDISRETSTDLRICPTLLMDRTLVGVKVLPSHELASRVAAAEAAFQRLWETVKHGNGSFVVCLHNECLSESGEWTGWSVFFESVIRTLQSGPAGE